jgi:ferric-dicitrate binding protein FerR (iron transport regulator)
MIRYENFTAIDFAKDDFFIRWVKKPNAESNAFFESLLIQNPQKRQIITQAKSFVLVAQSSVESPTELQSQKMWQAIEKKAFVAENAISRTKIMPFYRRPAFTWVSIAASVVFGLIIYFLSPPKATRQERVVAKETPLIEKVNSTAQPVTILLADGSSVFLQANSQLSYPRKFKNEKREVYLSGEAFFEVAKNANQPFIVYTNELTTEVLGTSFNVKAYQKDQKITVEVHTGKVLVSTKMENQQTQKQEKILLLPTQQLIFNRATVQIQKSVMSKQKIDTLTEIKQTFEFEDAPAVEVFEKLKNIYHVDIVYDKTLLANCLITLSLTDEPLFEKLDIICKAIEAKYETIEKQGNSEIRIQSKGCK